MELTVPDLRTGYVEVCRLVLRRGAPCVVRGLPTAELTGVTLVVPDVEEAAMLPVGVGRGINLKLAALEALGVVAGRWPHDLVLAAAPGYADVLVNGDDPDAAALVAYGPRLASQLGAVTALLRSDPTTRQAVLSIWQAGDLWRSGDRPCTVALQLLRRGGRLDLHTFMRSQDAWLGLGLDGFVFTQLQHTVARVLGEPAGRLVHHVGSLHVYRRDAARVENLTHPDPGAPPVDLPRGVTGTGPVPAVAAARQLLATAAPDPDVRTANPWYARQAAAARELLRV